MDIHEYQAKEILSGFGVPVPRGGLAYSPEQATYRARENRRQSLGCQSADTFRFQRRKSAVLLFVITNREIWDAAENLLGKRLVTRQTGDSGKVVYRLYVEEAVHIESEIYLGFVLDRKSERIMVMASAAGGGDIEEISAKNPERVIRVAVEPAVGMQQFQAREIAFALGL